MTSRRQPEPTPIINPRPAHPIGWQVPITSELGCVTPWLVVPGPWSEAELEHHARALTEGARCRRAGGGPPDGCLPALLDGCGACSACSPTRSRSALPAPTPTPRRSSGIASNCSCNCLAPKLVMLAEGWQQGDQFIAKVKAELALRPAPSVSACARCLRRWPRMPRLPRPVACRRLWHPMRAQQGKRCVQPAR